MQFFYTTESILLCFEEQAHGSGALSHRVGLACQVVPSAGHASVVSLEPLTNGRLTADSLYFALTAEFFDRLATVVHRSGRAGTVKLLRQKAGESVLSNVRMPRLLRSRVAGDTSARDVENQLGQTPPGVAPRLAIINRYATAFGDAVVSMTAFRELRRRLAATFPAVTIDLIQHPDNLETEALLLRSGVVDAIHHLPLPVAHLATYTAYFDLTLDHARPDLCWIDELLEAIGVDHRSVDSQRKRNVVPLDANAKERVARVLADARRSGRPVVLLHPEASTAIRTIPPAIARRIVEAIIEQTNCVVVLTASVAPPGERVFLLDGQTPSFADLVALVAAVDAFVCADTCVYHVADAFDVPGLVLFTSVAPEQRIQYYPAVRGVLIGGSTSPLLGRHYSDRECDFDAARLMWADFDPSSVADTMLELCETPAASVLA